MTLLLKKLLFRDKLKFLWYVTLLLKKVLFRAKLKFLWYVTPLKRVYHPIHVLAINCLEFRLLIPL